ncbi:MAG: MOSC domain-containing protein [Pyrinomonadaceae bacterium]|nr:MOSC domain-containing protein [Pyrinomonadaceae bacterium]
MHGRIFQLNCSSGGVPKTPVREARLTLTGLECDKQAHTRFHGGPERALCLFALELIRELQHEGHPIRPGSTGENVTIENLDWSQLKLGDKLSLGDEVVIQIASYTVPCKQIAASFLSGDFNRINQKTHAGWARLYARVLKTGVLRVNQEVRVLNEA